MPTKRFTIKVTPRSSQNRIIGTLPDGTIKVSLTTPPVDGEANKALITLLAKEWRVAKSKISIVKGERSRTKMIEVTRD